MGACKKRQWCSTHLAGKIALMAIHSEFGTKNALGGDIF
jgi:hypothetical protein